MIGIFLCMEDGVEVYPRQGKSPLEHQKIFPRLLAGEYFFWLLPGSRSLSPLGEIPAGAPKKSPRLFGGEIFFWSRPGSRSLSPAGEIPAGAPSKNAKNLVISTVTRFFVFCGVAHNAPFCSTFWGQLGGNLIPLGAILGAKITAVICVWDRSPSRRRRTYRSCRKSALK